MIDFAVIALPRSGTAWAANWLECPHEPLGPEEMLRLKGFSSTAAWLWPDFVYENVRRWVILERDPNECSKSLVANGYPELTQQMVDTYAALRGPRFYYTDLFNTASARDIWEYLKPDVKFDVDRHSRLATLKVETNLRYD